LSQADKIVNIMAQAMDRLKTLSDEDDCKPFVGGLPHAVKQEVLPDEDERKPFVGGLPQEVKQEILPNENDCKLFVEGLPHDVKQESLPDEDDRKLFVGGLPQDAKQDDISKHFQTYGEIDNINLKTDPATGRSRGFAFVVFKTVEGLKNAVASEVHAINGKKVAVKKAQAKQGKIYVGKLKSELSDEAIRSHFAQFGQIAQVEQPFDKTKNERKKFCFITFYKEASAKKLVKAGTTTVNGVELEVKKVTPKLRGVRGGFGAGYGYGDYCGGGYGYVDPYANFGGWGGNEGYGGGWGAFDQYGAKMGSRGAPWISAAGQRGGRGGRGRSGARHEPY